MFYPKSFFKQRQFWNEIRDGVHQSILRWVTLRRLNAQDEFVLKGMRLLVSSKQHIGVLQQLTKIKI